MKLNDRADFFSFFIGEAHEWSLSHTNTSKRTSRREEEKRLVPNGMSWKKKHHNKYVVNHSSILMISISETVLVELKCIFNILQNKICSSVLVSGSLSKYTHFFLFIFWWHQICSFPFCFSLLVFSTLQWHIHIICSQENLHEKKYF
jgi:hypothetical protein